MNIRTPCKDCPDRTTGDRTTDCHTTCERYAAFVAMKDEARRQRRLDAEVHSAVLMGHHRLKENPPTGGNKRH